MRRSVPIVFAVALLASGLGDLKAGLVANAAEPHVATAAGRTADPAVRMVAPGAGRNADTAGPLVATTAVRTADPAPALADLPRDATTATPRDSTTDTLDVPLAFAPFVGALGGTPLDAAAAGAGVTVQNAGLAPTRFLAVFFDRVVTRPRVETTCVACRATKAACSQLVAPGDSWTAAPTVGTSATVFALSDAPAAEAGSDWVGWLASHGVSPDASIADAVCTYMGADAPEPNPTEPTPEERCSRYRAFLRAFTTGDPGVFGAAGAPARGASLAVVAASASFPDDQSGPPGPPALDRYGAVDAREAGAVVVPDSVVTKTHYVPGIYLATEDGVRSQLAMQNAGAECATVEIAAFPAGLTGPYGDVYTVTVPPGDVGIFVPYDLWPLPKKATVRLTSDQPLAVVAPTVGFDTSEVVSGIRQRPPGVTWVMPLAYQEKRGKGADLEEPFSGWTSAFSIFGTAPQRWNLQIRAQAAGRADRTVPVPLDPDRTTVLEVGYGLDEFGGEGWVELSASAGAIHSTVDSVRKALGSPRYAEQWSSPAWPHGPGEVVARTIAFPDLGGPAVGPAPEDTNTGRPLDNGVSSSASVTTALETRIAVQNLLDADATVVFDGRAECGPADSITRTVPARAAIVVPARELPGVLQGANATLLRVIDGEVAAMLETARRERVVGTEDPPADLSSAYRGIGLSVTLPAPEIPPASMTVRPNAIMAEGAAGGGLQPVHLEVDYTSQAPRCLSYVADSPAPWLRPVPAAGALPADVQLGFDTRGLVPGKFYTTTLTVRATGPRVAGSPAAIPVSLHVTGGAPVYLPKAEKP